MKPLVAPLACGAAAAALLYGLLWAAERRLPEPEDPWLEAFISDGLKAEFQSSSTEPDKHLMFGDARERFAEPPYAGTVLRRYVVQNTSVQVARLPKAGLAPFIPEGRSFEFRLRRDGNPIHVSRTGRSMVFVALQGKWIPVVGQLRTPKPQVEEIFSVFEETVRKYP